MKLSITMLIHNKDDIEFVTEFPCFLEHPVLGWFHGINSNGQEYKKCLRDQRSFKGKEIWNLDENA